MNTYRINNTMSGTFMGTFEGVDAQHEDQMIERSPA